MNGHRPREATIPKARLDAITDGIFAFAMTLLVLDLRLPDGFNPASGGELVAALRDLQGQYLAYIISYYVLGLRWLAQVSERGVPEMVSGSYARWVLIYLFFITSIPFSTMVVGRYEPLPAATWVYAANMILSALCSVRLAYLADGERDAAGHRDRPELATLIASALLSVVLSFIVPAHAMWAYLLNIWPYLARFRRRRKASA
ncbi:MAG TPA: TMEM175 family protein [Bauldia sp.]|nr:TMEM175 family protein [Bauldia sp.]